jgi:hypothetical protein
MAQGWKDDAKAKNGFNTPMTSTCMGHLKCINSSSKFLVVINKQIGTCNLIEKKP